MATAPTPIKPKLPIANDSPAPLPKPPRRVPERLIQLHEHFNAIFATIAPHDWTLADVMRPEAFGLRHERMRVGD